ncbi:MAG TPA: Ig-like domain-containing protein [Burkholderiaceae bacterium]|nr:Ig-like domain-containing protein [Burkholderiaceae bacterium]
MPTRRAVVRSLVALTAPSWLVACGGGGGGGDSSTTANATANTASNATPFRIERATANATPTLVFSRPVDPSSTSAIRLLDSNGEPVAIDIVTAGKDVTLVPKERLALQGQYVVQADARVRGTNGETLADNVKTRTMEVLAHLRAGTTPTRAFGARKPTTSPTAA